MCIYFISRDIIYLSVAFYTKFHTKRILQKEIVINIKYHRLAHYHTHTFELLLYHHVNNN